MNYIETTLQRATNAFVEFFHLQALLINVQIEQRLASQKELVLLIKKYEANHPELHCSREVQFCFTQANIFLQHMHESPENGDAHACVFKLIHEYPVMVHKLTSLWYIYRSTASSDPDAKQAFHAYSMLREQILLEIELYYSWYREASPIPEKYPKELI